jgi:hypothetical protein
MKTPDILSALELRAKIRKLDRRLSLDDVLDDSRALSDISPGAFDYLMMAQRYESLLDAFFLKFTQKEIGPPRFRDFLVIGAAAIITRTHEPAEKQSHAMVEIVKQEWGKGASQFANALFRNLCRSLPNLKKELSDHPETLLSPELRHRWKDLPEIQKRTGRMLSQRPRPEISGFDSQGEFLFKNSSEALEAWNNGTNFFQAMDLGSFLWVEQIFTHFKKSAPRKSLRMMDLCAAPGAKLLLFQRLWNRYFPNVPASYFATDLKWSRLERLKENLVFYKSFFSTDTKLEVADHSIPNPSLTPQNPFDVYLADLPCSGSGTLHTRPDLGANIIEALANQSLGENQRNILKNLFQVAKTNSKESLVFVSVCSVDPLEIQNIESTIRGALPHKATPISKWTSWQATERDCEGITGWTIEFQNHV